MNTTDSACIIKRGPNFLAVRPPYHTRYIFVPKGFSYASDPTDEDIERYARKRLRHISYGPEWTPARSRERLRWVENASKGLRVRDAAHNVIRLRHTGWCMDPSGDYGRDGCDLAVGYVLQLPGKDREPCYVPAVADDCNPDCYMVDFHDVHSDRADCARAADALAEAYAEREREHREKEQSKDRAESLRDEAAALRRQHRAAIGDLRALRSCIAESEAPTACALLRDKLAAMRRRIRECLREASDLDAQAA